jgi:hypothetical protein
MIIALFKRKNDPGKRNATFDPVCGWMRQRLRVVIIHADRKGENQNFWLDWSQQRAKDGLTRCFEVIGLTPGAPRREALEIACTADNFVTDGPPRFTVRKRLAVDATDVAPTRFRLRLPAKGHRSRYGSFWKRRGSSAPTSTLTSYSIATGLASRRLATANPHLPCARTIPRSGVASRRMPSSSAAEAKRYTARMTIDVTPELNGHIKITRSNEG